MSNTGQKELDFVVQQVAVDLVVHIGVVLLLAEVQAGDVHGRLKESSRSSLSSWFVSKHQPTQTLEQN